MILKNLEDEIYKIAKKNHEDENEKSPDLHNKYYKDVTIAIKKAGGRNVKYISCDYYENLEKEIIIYANKRKRPFYVILDPYHEFVGWTNSGYIMFEHSKVKKHDIKVDYFGGFDKLAEDLGNLSYDALGEFLDKFCKKISKDGSADEKRGRKQLAKHLNYAAKHIEKCMEICKPFMIS
jgi:hypothetical protein